MTTDQWQVVAEQEHPAGAGLDPGGNMGIAEAARLLHVPDRVVDQLQTAVRAAIWRIAERDAQGTIRLTLATKAAAPDHHEARQSWGFFLIEKPPHETTSHRIEVFLYPDGG